MPEAKAKKNTAVPEPVAWENPLIPNKRLKALYAAMVELRLLEQYVASLRPNRGIAETLAGEEGCRVSTTFDLKPGDLTSDEIDGVSTAFLQRAKLAEVIPRAHTAASSKTPASGDASRGQLPAVENAIDRLHLAMGAALVLRATRKGALLVAYTHSSDATLADWKPMLRFAAEQVLPAIFVVLPSAPETKGTMKPGQLSLASSKCGVPGIPVDAADPVALYRVAQEAMLRARAGGGPVLMECIVFRPAGKKASPSDPIATMREFLLGRKIVDLAWLESVESRFRVRLEAVKR